MKKSPSSANTKRASKQKESQDRPLHTPGPWSVNPTGDIGPWIVGTSEIEVANCGGSDVEESEMEANARLIAAAPDLLEASQKFLAFYNDLAKTNPGFMGKLGLQDYAQWNEAMIELPNAIKKATSVGRGGDKV